MAEDKLVLQEERDGYAVTWLCHTDEWGDDIGAYLGDTDYPTVEIETKVLAAKTFEDFAGLEHEVATCTVRDFVQGLPDSVWSREQHRGYLFDRKADAQKALKLATAAVKALRSRAKEMEKKKTGTAWPLWAIQAKAAGWKAPKGWKP